MIGADRQLLFQDPEFGFCLLHFFVGGRRDQLGTPEQRLETAETA
jgi:hypothetical protein